MYGSNLRQGDDREGVLDLYALVTTIRPSIARRALVLANRLLPPNVFYLEAHGRNAPRALQVCRAGDRDLARLTSAHTAEPYFWARFAQPCALVYAADDAARDAVVAALAGAVTTFVRFGVPLAADAFDARDLWTSAWRATYGAEIRPERPGAADALSTPPRRALRARDGPGACRRCRGRARSTTTTGRASRSTSRGERERAARAWRVDAGSRPSRAFSSACCGTRSSSRAASTTCSGRSSGIPGSRSTRPGGAAPPACGARRRGLAALSGPGLS